MRQRYYLCPVMNDTKKQTAVQWLVDKVERYPRLLSVDIIEQAIAMEREQIFDAFKIDPGYHDKEMKAKNYYDWKFGQ